MPPDSLSLYIHIPFCKTKCSYCAFNTYTGMDTLVDPYLAALDQEIMQVAAQVPDSAPAHTLYFGGGTPSLLAPAQVTSLIDRSRAAFSLLDTAEISLECNPGDADIEAFSTLKSAGVNRVSIGVQSAHHADLVLFSRRHSFEDAHAAFEMARAAGFDNINVDLIYGAPDQTLSQWSDTLGAVLRWHPDHVSLYSLSLEEGTTLARQVHEGILPSPDPDLAADMYDLCREKLAANGFVHYEISNWARPDKECRHNIQYWVNQPFLGFGAGAHGYAATMRYWNVKPIPTYIQRVIGKNMSKYGQFPALEGMESIDGVTEMSDTVILGLRLLSRGINPADFEARFGQRLMDIYGEVIIPLVDSGFLMWKDSALLLSPKAYLVSNQIFHRFIPDAQGVN